LSSLKIVFFSLSEQEEILIEGFFRELGIVVRRKIENFYEHVYTVEGKNLEEIREKIQVLGGIKFLGFGDLSLEERLKREALKEGVTLAIGESCTGGLISSRITDVPGSSSYFLGGVVAYSNFLKMSLLGVREETLREFGAVSGQVAEEMVRGVVGLSGADYGVAVTGIAGPEGGTPEKPVGTVWFGICTPTGIKTELKRFTGCRSEIKYKTSSYALFYLLSAIGRAGRFE
jgi:PncC family amidohydrolase